MNQNPYQSPRSIDELAVASVESRNQSLLFLLSVVLAISLPAISVGAIVGIRYLFSAATRTLVLGIYTFAFPLMCIGLTIVFARVAGRSKWEFIVFASVAVVVAVVQFAFLILVSTFVV